MSDFTDVLCKIVNCSPKEAVVCLMHLKLSRGEAVKVPAGHMLKHKACRAEVGWLYLYQLSEYSSEGLIIKLRSTCGLLTRCKLCYG